ncbi:hypothetical protein Q5L94_08385 [Idiomarina sp. Sol25]|uniref:hypothetical protein n=1 Tax=Idiomarina sp. Sol25 TaxID=3064000 RepID=UPI00294B2996|nr:hypothetical protein [Idiomarina sp. Sol25]MDV6328074.1 hypothetical protein [Idiomarina sp. Sol25]
MNLEKPLSLNFEGQSSKTNSSKLEAESNEYVAEKKLFKQQISNLQNKLEDSEKLAKELEEKNEKLGVENLNLLTQNSELKKKNDALADSVRRIEIQMDLLKELFQRD